MGAEVILHPIMTGNIDRETELSIARAMVTVNQCFFFDVNGLYTGGSGRCIVCVPDGRVLYQASSTEEVIPIELDIERVKKSLEKGLLRLGQLLKSFRDHIDVFTIHDNGEKHPYLEELGSLIKPGHLVLIDRDCHKSHHYFLRLPERLLCAVYYSRFLFLIGFKSNPKS